MDVSSLAALARGTTSTTKPTHSIRFHTFFAWLRLGACRIHLLLRLGPPVCFLPAPVRIYSLLRSEARAYLQVSERSERALMETIVRATTTNLKLTHSFARAFIKNAPRSARRSARRRLPVQLLLRHRVFPGVLPATWVFLLDRPHHHLHRCFGPAHRFGGERAKRASLDEDKHTRDESNPSKWLQA